MLEKLKRMREVLVELRESSLKRQRRREEVERDACSREWLGKNSETELVSHPFSACFFLFSPSTSLLVVVKECASSLLPSSRARISSVSSPPGPKTSSPDSTRGESVFDLSSEREHGARQRSRLIQGIWKKKKKKRKTSASHSSPSLSSHLPHRFLF